MYNPSGVSHLCLIVGGRNRVLISALVVENWGTPVLCLQFITLWKEENGKYHIILGSCAQSSQPHQETSTCIQQIAPQCWALCQSKSFCCYCSDLQAMGLALTMGGGTTDHHVLYCLSSPLFKFSVGPHLFLHNPLVWLSTTLTLWQGISRLPEL
jgi:hypothetical protein